LNDLINDSRGKLDLFINRWGDLSNRVPRNNPLQSFDELASIFVSVDPEIRFKKFASLHGYEFLNTFQSQGNLNFVENYTINNQNKMHLSSDNIFPNSNLIQNNSYYTNNNQNSKYVQQSGNPAVTYPRESIQNNNIAYFQGNTGLLNSGFNNNSNIVGQGIFLENTPGSELINTVVQNVQRI
jgi:hypothetical protein